MTRTQTATRRYRAAAEVGTRGASVVVIEDAVGTRFDAALWALLKALPADDTSLLESVTGPARAVRWRRLTRPVSVPFAISTNEAVDATTVAADQLLGSTGLDQLLVELKEAARAIGESTPPVFEVLVRSIHEVGDSDCLVVTVDNGSSAAIRSWSDQSGVQVLSASALNRLDGDFDQTLYALGPPRFFPPTLLGAPTTGDLNFLVPSWFRDRECPSSPLSKYAEGSAVGPLRVLYESGPPVDAGDANLDTGDESRELQLMPQPPGLTSLRPNPDCDVVLARQLTLSGSWAVWLDDGERIRTLDPSQPEDERVQYQDIESIERGTFLLLRDGEAGHGAMINEALDLLAELRSSVEGSQAEWKGRLEQRLGCGADQVVGELRRLGCSTAHRAPAWVDPYLVRPDDNHDFRRLLTWLEVDVDLSESNANLLRRAVHQATAQVRRELEAAASAADMAELERVGHININSVGDNVRSIVAARVLGISNEYALVGRHETRMLMSAPEAQWLE